MLSKENKALISPVGLNTPPLGLKFLKKASYRVLKISLNRAFFKASNWFYSPPTGLSKGLPSSKSLIRSL